MSKVVELPQASFSGKYEKPAPPRKPKNTNVRSREHLTPAEVDKLIATAGKIGRHGHRDRTLVLVMYRHGLRVSEAVALRWDQVDLDAGLVHINRRKNGTPSTHPLGGTEIRALRKLKRDYPATQYVFVTERKGPMTDSAVRKLIARAGGRLRLPGASAHAAPQLRLQAGQRWPGHPRDPALPGTQEHPAYGKVHRAGAGEV